jgi:hypothetical protein
VPGKKASLRKRRMDCHGAKAARNDEILGDLIFPRADMGNTSPRLSLLGLGQGRERAGKKTTHARQKAELFHTFRIFFAFAPLRLLQNAKMLLAWHACLGPEPTPIMRSPVAALLNAAQHTQGA